MTPEEKLLALIQQDKRQADGAASPAVAPKPPEPVSPPPPSRSPEVAHSVAIAEKKEEKKLKLADSPPAKPVKAESSSPAPVAVAMPTPVPAPLPPPAAPLSVAVPAPAAPAVVDTPVREMESEAVEESPFVTLTPSRGPSLVFFNRILGLVVILLIVLVAVRIGAIRPGIAEALETQVSGAGTLPVRPLVVTEEAVPALDAYLDKVSTRNIFMPKVGSRDTGGGAVPETVGAPKDLKLVAVSMDSSSVEESMAIIKNKADSKTYFVKMGQTIGSTEYVLDKVFSDRVIVKLRRQEFELK